MRRDKRAADRRLHSPQAAAAVALLTTALLRVCAGAAASALPSASAAAVGGGLSPPSPSLVTFRRSGRGDLFLDEQQQQRAVPPFTPASPRGSRSSSATSPSWFAVRTTRGGGIFRRRRGGGGGGGGSTPAAAAAVKCESEAEERGAGEAPGTLPSKGFAVAAGTVGGGGGEDGSRPVDEKEEEGATDEGQSGGGSYSDDQGAANRQEGGDDNGDSLDEDDGQGSDSGSMEGEEEEEKAEDEEEEEEGEGEAEVKEEEEVVAGVDDEEAAAGAAAMPRAGERRKPVAPLFSFPPGPRVHRTEAEESLQEVLPMQQRLVKYLTEDRVFGAQILLSIYFVMSAVAYTKDSVNFRGCYQAALAALTLKHWGTVLGRVRRVLVPHLLYEPQRYVKYRARVSALALDPAVQGIVYCAIFMFMPLGQALLPLLLKETVYLVWVIKEVLQIAAPGLVEALISLFEPLMSVVMTAGDREKWRTTPPAEKRLLLGRRLAQLCFKLEMVMPFGVALRVLPGALQATLAAGGGVAQAATAAGGAEAGGELLGEGGPAAVAAVAAGEGRLYGQVARTLPLMKIGMLMMAYVKLLTVKNGQLEDDVQILKGLKIRGYNCEWLEQVADSVAFGKMVGCPWWSGLIASVFTILPNQEATKTFMASEDKLKTLGMGLLNLAIGRRPGEEDEDDESDEPVKEDVASPAPPKSGIVKIAKIAAVATGVSDF